MEEDEQQMNPQLQLIREYMERNKESITTLQSEMGGTMDYNRMNKVQSFESENRFYENQESRLQEALQLMEQEKALLTSKFESLRDQLKNLQSYLDLKDGQIRTLTTQLNEHDEKWKEREEQLGRSSVTIQSLNETISKLQDENASLEKKIKAYFSFGMNHSAQNSLTHEPDALSSQRTWDAVPTRGRGASEQTTLQSTTTFRRRKSLQKEDGDNLLKQQGMWRGDMI